MAEEQYRSRALSESNLGKPFGPRVNPTLRVSYLGSVSNIAALAALA